MCTVPGKALALACAALALSASLATAAPVDRPEPRFVAGDASPVRTVRVFTAAEIQGLRAIERMR